MDVGEVAETINFKKCTEVNCGNNTSYNFYGPVKVYMKGIKARVSGIRRKKMSYRDLYHTKSLMIMLGVVFLLLIIGIIYTSYNEDTIKSLASLMKNGTIAGGS